MNSIFAAKIIDARWLDLISIRHHKNDNLKSTAANSPSHVLLYCSCANPNWRERRKIGNRAKSKLNQWESIAQAITFVFYHSFLFVSQRFSSDNRYDCGNRYVPKKIRHVNFRFTNWCHRNRYRTTIIIGIVFVVVVIYGLCSRFHFWIRVKLVAEVWVIS